MGGKGTGRLGLRRYKPDHIHRRRNKVGGIMAWNLISAFLSKRRARLRKEQLRRERGQAEYAVLSGYEDQIQERTMRKLAEMLQLPADELVAAAASRGEMAVVSELERRYPEDEVLRTWGQTRGHLRRDLFLKLRRQAADRPG